MKLNYLFTAIFIWLHSNLSAQFTQAEIGVDGLTCSQCTRSVELKIRQLPFVDTVIMDLGNTNGIIIFKQSTNVIPQAIAQAVIDAGFSLRYLIMEYNFNNLAISPATTFAIEPRQFCYIGPDTKTLSGKNKMKLIGEQFLPRKEYKKWKSKTRPQKADTVYYFTI